MEDIFGKMWVQRRRFDDILNKDCNIFILSKLYFVLCLNLTWLRYYEGQMDLLKLFQALEGISL